MEKLDTNITESGRTVAILSFNDNNMEQQQERLDTDIIESGRAVAILSTTDNNLIQAESVREESREAKRGRRERMHWTKDEHVLFLKGLKKYGKGRWKDISKEFVVTKTPAQIVSHAQKYFIHLNATEKEKKRRKSIHDTSVEEQEDEIPSIEKQSEIPHLVAAPMEEQQTRQNEKKYGKRRSIHDTSVEQEDETPQGMQQTESTQQSEEIHPVLCLLYPIGSILPDAKKIEKMRNLLAKELEIETQQSEN